MARISAPFGIKGWVRLFTFTGTPESLGAFPVWLIRRPTGWQEFAVEEFSVNAKGAVARLAGCVTRNDAELLAQCDVAVPRQALAATGEDEYYWVDLIGSTVVNAAHEELGVVATLMQTGANDVLVVRAPGVEDRLIPFVKDVVVGFDREARQVRVEWGKDY